jgi:hypothetical protein
MDEVGAARRSGRLVFFNWDVYAHELLAGFGSGFGDDWGARGSGRGRGDFGGGAGEGAVAAGAF